MLSPRRPHHGPIQSPNHPRLARTPESQGHPILPWFFQLLPSFHLQKSPFHLCTLPARVHHGTFPMSAILPLKHLKRLSPQLWSLPIGSQTLKLQSRLMPPTMHLPQSFQSQLQMANCTQLHSTPGHFRLWNSTTMSMKKSYLQFLKLSNDGNITSKALDFQLMWSLITRIGNIFQ